MKELTDEMLNKLIDNELSSSEIDELHKLIKQNDEFLSRAKAHQMVDSVLKNLRIENAPENTTEIIMEKITKSILYKERKNGFFKFVMGTFAVSILLVIGFVISSASSGQENSGTQFESIRTYMLEILSRISFPINNEILSIITSALTVIILISGYFIFEQHRSFKQKLDRIL